MYLTTTNTAQFSLYHITCVNFDAILAWLPCVFLCFVKTISPGLECSLYADDFLICYRSKYIHITERHIQQCLNKLSDSADTNSFKFSSSKLYACISADFTNCTRILCLHWIDHPFLLLKKLNFLVSYLIVNSRFYLAYDTWKWSAQRHWTCSVLSHTQRGEQISKHWSTYTDLLSDLNWTMAVLSMALLEAITYASWIRSKIMHFVCAWVPTERPPLLVYLS